METEVRSTRDVMSLSLTPTIRTNHASTLEKSLSVQTVMPFISEDIGSLMRNSTSNTATIPRRVKCYALRARRSATAMPRGRSTCARVLSLRSTKDEILRLVHNEETRAKGTNPLERIIEVNESAEGVTVTTTNEKLAQRIGRMLKSSYQGHTTYHWSDPKFLNVEWYRAA